MIMEFDEISQFGFAEFKAQYMSGLDSDEFKDDIEFRLHVGSNNFLELQYYILLLDSLRRIHPDGTKLKTVIISNATGSEKDVKKQRGEDWGRINTYLSCFSDSIFKNRDIFDIETFGNLRLTSPDKLNFHRIVPLLPVDRNIYEFLSQRVEDAFAPSIILDKGKKRFNCNYEIRTEKLRKSDNERSIQIKLQKDFLVSIQGLFSYDETAWNVLYSACMKYLFDFDNRSKTDHYCDLFIKRISLYSSPEFFNQVRNISVFSFLIFCAFNRFILSDKLDNIQNSDLYKKSNPKFSNKILHENNVYPNRMEDESILINALDMAEGLLQLIENAVFHAGNPGKQDGFAVLSLRVYKEGQQSREKYLNDKYRHYFEGHDDRLKIALNSCGEYVTQPSSYQQNLLLAEKKVSQLSKAALEEYLSNNDEITVRKKERSSSTYYLEVRLTDNSGKNMCAVFLDNHKNDPGFPFSRSGGKHVKVRTFFDPDSEEQDFWHDFNTNPDNVIHHYGLQLFDAMLRSLDGCFVVQSIADGEQAQDDNFFSTSGDRMSDYGKRCFSGTQYSILLPFISKKNRLFSIINTDVELRLPSEPYFINDSSNHPILRIFSDALAEYRNLHYGSQEEKKRLILGLCSILENYNPDGKTITVFDASELSAQNAELFAKSLVQFIAKGEEREINIAVTNCSDDNFKQLIRFFAIFYDRKGDNSLMKRTRIYLSGKNRGEENFYNEFRFAGMNLHDALAAQIKLDAARGITRESRSGILSFLFDMLKRRPGRGNPGSLIEHIPFELLTKNGTSIFEESVTNILMSDVQQKNPGCLISPNHMRIGSKIHVDKFYEAKYFFGSNYYTGCFAWMLKERISQVVTEPCTQECPYLFIGYESYSEILLRDICKQYPYSEYCVYEYGVQDPLGIAPEARFRRINMLKRKKYRPIYVVPINSTLSTFNKLEASFSDEIKERNRVSGKFIDIMENAEYFGVIQTRHGNSNIIESCEEEFFASIDTSNKSITSTLLSNRVVHYLFCVRADWSNPLQCEQCYPIRGRYTLEKPLIETDKTSVIPAQLYGIKVNDDYNKYEEEEADDRIAGLYGNVIFGHTLRNSNHFQYYIITDELFEEASNTKIGTSKIQNWLKGVRGKIVYKNEIHYDIIVCPEHHSNPGFIKLVNEVVFGGASLVIHINIGEEFRDNFKTKHSDITNIIENLSTQNVVGEINFHFVDDTIIHGSNFSRAKSLINSLCLDRRENVTVNIFRSVILLLNRNSGDSIQNYCDDPANFHAYINLFISSLRTYNGECILCREADEYQRLRKRASLNITYEYFMNTLNHMKERDAVSSANEKHPGYTKSTYDEFVLMICTHYLNKAISGGQDKNYRSGILRILIQELFNSLKKADSNRNGRNSQMPVPEPMTLIISYIIAASSPYQSFRKATREAVFKLILLLFEVLLDPNLTKEGERKKTIRNFLDKSLANQNEYDERRIIGQNRKELEDNLLGLIDIVIKLTEDRAAKLRLLQTLMKQSVTLKSTYIIRRDNIFRILWVSIVYKFDDILNKNDNSSFAEYYLFLIKTLIASGTDKAKSMFVEYLLLSGREYPKYISKKDLLRNSYSCFRILDSRLTQCIIARYFGFGLAHDNIEKLHDLLKRLVYNVFLENTQIIYDAVRDLNKHKKNEESTNELYFLENYKSLLRWNGYQDQTGNTKIKESLLGISGQIVDLYAHLDRYGSRIDWARNSKYYKILLNHVKQILNTEKVYLFIGTEPPRQLFPDDHYADFDLREHVRKVAEATGNPNIGRTYYFEDNQCIRTIKFGQYGNKEQKGEDLAWYLTFITEEKGEDINLNELIKVRNLLALRSTVLNQFKKDFDNNQASNYIELKDKVLKLSNEKTGSHTPFIELAEAFSSVKKITDRIEENEITNTDNSIVDIRGFLADQMKLITDSLISRWYVYSIIKMLPEQINPQKEQDDDHKLYDLKNVLLLAEFLKVDAPIGELRPKINWDMEWEKFVTVPDKSDFVWCAAFFALILNALRHGFYEEGIKVVYISVRHESKNKKRFLKISNRKQDGQSKNNKNNGITLHALEYFFRSYGYDGFTRDQSSETDFIVWLPLEKK